MQTWAILAAKHAALTSGIGLGVIPAAGWDSLDGVVIGMLLAGIGYAIVSARRVPGCQVPPVGAEIAADGSDPAGGRRMARLRRRMDGLLTGILSDDADRLTQAAASSRRMVMPARAEEHRFIAPAAWRGNYVDALPRRRLAGSHPYPETRAGAPGRSGASAGPPWPWLTASAAVDGERRRSLGRKHGQAGEVDDAAEFDELERALAAGKDWDDVRPLPSPAERRRDAVQRFIAAPVVDLDLARVARTRAQVRPQASCGDAERVPAVREHAVSANGADSRDGTAARRWSAGPGGDKSAAAPRATDGDASKGAAPETGGPETGRPETGGTKTGGTKTAAPGEPLAGAAETDESFRGRRGAADDDADGGYRSRHRSDGQAQDKPQDGRRAKPRHAAPPSSFGATLSRRLTRTKLTNRSAAHAG